MNHQDGKVVGGGDNSLGHDPDRRFALLRAEDLGKSVLAVAQGSQWYQDNVLALECALLSGQMRKRHNRSLGFEL